MGVRRVVTLCVGVCVSVGDSLAASDPVLERVGESALERVEVSVGVRVYGLLGVGG